jgi:glycosyltransferase involved in cell wall biosynthesis
LKILIIISEYKPYVHPRAHRWSAIAELWATQGHEVHIVTSKVRGHADEGIDNGVAVHRAGVGSLKELINLWLPKRTSKGVVDSGTPQKSIFNTIISFVNDKIWRKIMWPDSAVPWQKSAEKLAETIIISTQPDLMISVALPFTNARVGERMKAKFPNLTWIADFGDPFSLNTKNELNNHFFYGNKNKKSELKLLQHVDYLTVTTVETRNSYINFAPFVADKCIVIPPLFHQEKLEDNTLQIRFYPNKKHIAYFGSFYSEERSPLDFLDIWQHFLIKFPNIATDFELHFFGNINTNLYQKMLNVPRVTCHGLLSRAASSAAMRDVDFLLNIGNKGAMQLPSKCVDYLAAAKPILQYSYAEHDLFDAFFEDYSNYKAIQHQGNLDAKTDELCQFLTKKQASIDKKIIAARLEKYGVEAIAGEYSSLGPS